ncbi:chromosome segregation protein SMC [Clostridium sp. Marseille-P299]|uniref:chromosome segregation protein SMC n=1 Tax=Clostridium sp. Marseille-P299 TaxID=1805477 RepID=UPI000830086F|nr:chromosome segregation protein SMC [Clostridium sp. Marseille-P299]
MYLKSIEVHGFKSFANKILFEFHNGITGIVGPNGSGKSNVADAVRWVLGEQSAKQLRGSNMQDVIFSGTEMRKPLGFAYVAITLDNSDHKLPIEYDEVTVARRVYRSGESEYLINGSHCRLKDVQELFLDTGIGKEGYSIIGQGQIDKILSGKPEERRELFDEAAGIVKFKKRKAIAEKNLEEERQNLSRITDIISEIEKQIGPLEKQSIVAREYLKRKEELKKFEVNQFLIEYDKNNKVKQEIDHKFEIVAGDLEQTKQEYDNTKNRYEKLESELEELNTVLEEVRTKKNELGLSIEKTEGEIKVLEEQIASIIQNDKQFQSRIASLQKDIEVKRQELHKYTIDKQEIDEKLDAIDDKQAMANETLNAIKERIIAYTKEIEECNNEIFRVLNENGTIKTNIQRYETINEQNNIKKAEINQKILKTKSEEATIQIVLEERREELQRVTNDIVAIQTLNQDLEQNLGKEQVRIDNLSKEFNDNQQANMIEQAKLESLKNLTERYDGYGMSIRRVMEAKEKNDKIVGVVADIIKVEKEYETAVETALGGNIQNIVTEDESTAKALIEYLKKNKFGRATFLPLTSIKGSTLSNKEALKENGAIGIASDLIQVDDKFKNLVQFLLGRILVVDQIDNALAIARKYNYSLRIVTLEGEQLNPGGSLSGGAYKNSSNLLGRRREIEELEQTIQKRKNQMIELEQDIKIAREQRKSMRESLEANKVRLQELYVNQNTAKLQLNQEESKVEVMRQTYLEFASELKELEIQNHDLLEQMERLQTQLLENMNYSKAKEARIDECNKLLEEEHKNEQKANEGTVALHVEFSNLEQSSNYALENIKRVKKDLERLLQDETNLREDAKMSMQAKLEREELVNKNTSKKDFEQAELNHSEEMILSYTEQKESMTRDHKSFLQKREELSNRLNELDKESFRLQNQGEKVNELLDSQISYMWEEYELTVSSANELKDDSLEDSFNYKKAIQELKNIIKNLGDVNVNAIEDFKNLSERFTFLTTQKEDLEAAEASLIEIINELDIEMRKQFEEKFSEIRTQFDLVFKELFGGGKGTLELTEDEDILEAGIRIIAQPPGKKLQNMMQLSGGEKALTAISLLFAIQNLKPSPFCLLDEIEAALDDSNVKRYANYLHKLTKDTQFIIITHRRGTMAAADILYGITMQEKGVSTLVSVNLIEGELDK